MESSYKKLYEVKPFTIAFTDREFETVEMEIVTDSVSYIYEFGITEQRLQDTLHKYGIASKPVQQLIGQMQRVHCAWINNSDYYVNNKEQRLIFISIKPVKFRWPFTPAKYYILAYFFQKQFYDGDGHLLDKRRSRKLRKINGQVFTRITDRVSYTVSEKFR
jgi:hypothetical protein